MPAIDAQRDGGAQTLLLYRVIWELSNWVIGRWVIELLDYPITQLPNLVCVMANVSRGHHEDDVFRDVRGVIPDPFEVPGHEDQVERGLDRMGVCLLYTSPSPRD